MGHRKDETPVSVAPSVERIRKALEDLGEDWMYTGEFVAEYGISRGSLDRHKSKFEGYRIAFGNTFVWSGSKATLLSLTERLNA